LFLNLLIKGLIVDSRRNALKSAHLLWIIIMKSKSLEWFGVVTAIMYSMMVALNIGVEFAGFLLLLVSALSIGYWAYLGKHRGILFLQFFYATAGIIGMVRWY
jgi:hypothetical protein